MWKALVAGTVSLLASAAWAQAPGQGAMPPDQPSGLLTGVFVLGDGGWTPPRVTADAFMQEQQERRLGIMHSTSVAAQAKPAGLDFDVTGKLLGNLQYHWTAGQKPELGLSGVPIRARIRTNGVYFGFSYRP